MEALSRADIIALRQELADAVVRADEAEVKAAEACADAANARAINADLEARIALQALQALQIELLRRDRFGKRSAAAKTTTVTAFVRTRPSRQPLPAHLPRTRVVIPSPTCCSGCGSVRPSKLGEDTTETLEVVTRQ